MNRDLEAMRAENDELVHQQSQLQQTNASLQQRAEQAEKAAAELQEEMERHKRMEGELRDLVTRGQESCEALQASAEEMAKEAKEAGGVTETEKQELQSRVEKQERHIAEAGAGFGHDR